MLSLRRTPATTPEGIADRNSLTSYQFIEMMRHPVDLVLLRFSMTRQYWLFAVLVLGLAAFNLTFHINQETVTEWDESLYAMSAWEMLGHHQWIGTTFKGALDYYNTKPPLNIWLIYFGFKAFGINLMSLRLPSIASAWLTVVVLQEWARRAVGPHVAILASVVLATSFGFLYDHSGRTANTDALFALLVLLTVVTLWASYTRPRRLIWLGPVAAATFLLRGMGVLMPLAIVLVVEGCRPAQWRQRWRWHATAAALFLIPVGAWVWARWQLDEWRFLGPLFTYDFVARTVRVIEEHHGSVFYHLNVLLNNEFPWLLAAIVALVLFPPRWTRVRQLVLFWRSHNTLLAITGAWIAVTLLIPTLIRTKLSWYLNPFYPAFAFGLACFLVRGWSTVDVTRRRVLAATVLLAVGVVETRVLWFSFHRRSLAVSTQGFLLEERQTLAGHGVYRDRWPNNETFVLDAMVGADANEAGTFEDFMRDSDPGDFWLSERELRDARLKLIGSHGRRWLYRRIE